MKLRTWKAITIGLLFLTALGLWTYTKSNPRRNMEVGQKIDSLNGVYVYYNAGVRTVKGRNTSEDGYNLGLKYQCVEFVKRYYYEHLDHKMPDSYGHAKHFYKKSLRDGEKNLDRGLTQYTNPSKYKPEVNDLLIYSPTTYNRFGHVAIVSKASNTEIEII